MLTELQKSKFRRAFLAYDRNNDGTIELDEFMTGHENILRGKGLKPSHDTWKNHMSHIESWWSTHLTKADINKDGQISGDEYLAYLEAELGNAGNDPANPPPTFGAVEVATLLILDVDGDGVVNADDYAACIQAFGIDDFDTEGNFAKLDTDGDGVLSKDEAILRVREFFLSDDANAVGNTLWGPF
jgi:Ca2+-binding EF-hand superfamily protein